MENATKALIMAGAVLITIIVLGLFMYFWARLEEFPKQQEEIKEKKQITEFNREYESYDKDKMYGVDVVTIMNKVINNNKNYADIETGEYLKGRDNHFINVKVKLKTPIIKYAEVWEDAIGPNRIETGSISGVDADGNDVKPHVLGEVKFGENKSKITEINLLTENSKSFFTNTTVEEFFSDAEVEKIYFKNKDKQFNYKYVYSGFTDFKRRKFQCTSITYNADTSRVSEICFEQIDSE